MKTLTRAEEEIMQVLWNLDKAFVKDITSQMKAPKPHYNTVSTILSILVEKKFVSYESFGKSYQYFPIVSKETYSKKLTKHIIKKYYGNSLTNLVTQMVEDKTFKAEKADELIKEIRKAKKMNIER